MASRDQASNELSTFGVLLRDVIRRLGDPPDDVSLTEIAGEQATIFEISTRKSDHGKVVGRRGELIDALRQVALCRGGRDARSYRIEVLEAPDVPTPRLQGSGLDRPGDKETKAANSTPETISTTSALLVRIVQSLVDHPDQVEVVPLQGAQTAVFEVSVAPTDMPRVLGKHGKTADAVRRLLISMGSRVNRRFLLEILEP